MGCKFDKDNVKLILQGLLCRKVSDDEVDIFLLTNEYLIDYDEMWQRVWEQYHTGDVPYELIPIETLLFRQTEYCITPKDKLEECLWIDLGNLWVYKEDIERLFKGYGEFVKG